MSKRTPYQFKEITEAPELVPKIWRSLDEKAQKATDSEGFRKAAAAEFPTQFNDVVSTDNLFSRRNFMSLSGGAAALFGLNGCILRRPEEKILPYTKAPEYGLPGIALHYATVIERWGEPLGLIVESHEGRPTKVEGNPNHPMSLGATDLGAQAEMLNLYDPDRAKTITLKGNASDVEALRKAIAGALGSHGEGAAVLYRPTTSPTFHRIKAELSAKFPKCEWVTYGPAVQNGLTAGIQAAGGQAVEPRYKLDKAKVVVSFDADILGYAPGTVRMSRDFASNRRIEKPSDEMNRLYVVEPTLSITGSNADHRARVAAKDIEAVVLHLADALRAQGVGDFKLALPKLPDGISATWLTALATDLKANQGASLVVVGEGYGARVQALCAMINQMLGNEGSTVVYYPARPDAKSDSVLALHNLTGHMLSGAVKHVFILDGNPVVDAPSDLKFVDALTTLAKNGTAIHLSNAINETSKVCGWHVPLAHAFESWGDAVSVDGTYSVQQPLIAPLFGAWGVIDLMSLMLPGQNDTAHAHVQQTFKAISAANGLFEASWRQVLKTGIYQQTSVSVSGLNLKGENVAKLFQTNEPTKAGVEVVFSLDPKMEDGRGLNNPWLLEAPDPITKVTWDNVALMSPATAKALSLKNGDKISIEAGTKVGAVAWVLPGQADNSVAVNLGWGLSEVGRYGRGHGFNMYPLRTSSGMRFRTGANISKEGGVYPISVTQEHNSMEGRAIALDATLEDYRHHPDFAKFRAVQPSTPPLWQEVQYTGHKWGMSVDLNACTGCSACMIACQSENNVPVVGKQEVARGREMHWLRIDRYFVGESEADPAVAFQPVACVHCEEAPCENVCPVNATVHSPEGTNDMAYNRCIGTRYCANNCPYKVRRFNFKDWHGTENGTIAEVKKMTFNPNVTVRMRGVMEKCTYCIQRIEEGKLAAKRQDRGLKDGEIVSACQQACPTGAIVFGDLNQKDSKVAKLSASDRGYKLLGDIGTQPRTTYLAKIRNPNPMLASHHPDHHAHTEST